jgi:CDP-glycerol glycerophosphotransferase
MRDLSSVQEPTPSRPSPVPLLSIVIPTFQAEPFIEDCLDAIGRQEFQSIEIIVVDGGSKDQTPVLLEKRMTDEPRLIVICKDRIGPGRARNEGARHAIGEYLWFVDVDDRVAPGALTPIAERLIAQRPDVLLVNHAVLRADASLEKGQDDQLITGADPQPFTIAERPWMLEMGLVSWNKIVRREFFRSTQAEFASSWPHEDVPVSCKLLLSAPRLSVLNHVCYHYWKQRPGSATDAAGSRHFCVFDVWRPILARYRDDLTPASGCTPVTKDLYRRLFQRAIWHCSTILDTAGYIAREDRRAFFAQMSALYADFAPPGYQPPGGFRGIKFALIARDFYAGHMALDPVMRARVTVQRRISGQ